jgi:hypothetical protein
MCFFSSYNRYLAVASRVVRRSLKEEHRLKAERRGEMDLKFAKWEVSARWMDTGKGTEGGKGERTRTRGVRGRDGRGYTYLDHC